MATRKQSSGTTESLVEESSVDNVIDGIEDTNTISGTSESTIRTIGFLETEGELIPLEEGTDTTSYIFVGIAGTEKVYRK